MSKYLFYPGCSMQRSARSYLDSTLAIGGRLGVEPEEIRDWNCCGATEYISVHNAAAHALVARNLALAAGQANGSDTIVAACSACYLNLAKTNSYMKHDRDLGEMVNQALAAGGLRYEPGTLKVRHLLDVVVNEIGLDGVKSQVVKPLNGLRIAPYYGCMIARPDRENRWDHVEHPLAMDHLMEAIGAEVVDYPMKTHCCGGHMTQIDLPVAYELIRRLIHGAAQHQADVIVTLCPMCQLNLDAYQVEVNRYFKTDFHVPVLYFTQLVGLAFGFTPEAMGIGKEFVDARPALSRIGVEAPAPDGAEASRKPARRREPKEGLPMPRMSGREGKRS